MGGGPSMHCSGRAGRLVQLRWTSAAQLGMPGLCLTPTHSTPSKVLKALRTPSSPTCCSPGPASRSLADGPRLPAGGSLTPLLIRAPLHHVVLLLQVVTSCCFLPPPPPGCLTHIRVSITLYTPHSGAITPRESGSPAPTSSLAQRQPPSAWSPPPPDLHWPGSFSPSRCPGSAQGTSSERPSDLHMRAALLTRVTLL